MAGTSHVEAAMSIIDRLGVIGPMRIAHAVSQTRWVGPVTITVATGTTEQAIITLGTQGLTTITALWITSDVNISVTYGAAASNVPIALNAGAVHCMSGTSLTALAFTNNSGSLATVSYMAAGS